MQATSHVGQVVERGEIAAAVLVSVVPWRCARQFSQGLCCFYAS